MTDPTAAANQFMQSQSQHHHPQQLQQFQAYRNRIQVQQQQQQQQFHPTFVSNRTLLQNYPSVVMPTQTDRTPHFLPQGPLSASSTSFAPSEAPTYFSQGVQNSGRSSVQQFAASSTLQ